MTDIQRNLYMERHRDHSARGYDVELVEEIPERLKCPLCETLMRDPIQTIRGELACEICYESNLR